MGKAEKDVVGISRILSEVHGRRAGLLLAGITRIALLAFLERPFVWESHKKIAQFWCLIIGYGFSNSFRGDFAF